jgi:hypothetical protein
VPVPTTEKRSKVRRGSTCAEAPLQSLCCGKLSAGDLLRSAAEAVGGWSHMQVSLHHLRRQIGFWRDRVFGVPSDGVALRILVTHHGPLQESRSPVTGGALRAGHIVQALSAAGHQVFHLCRSQDQPGGFSGPADLRARAKALRPDRIICIQLEDAPALSGLGIPLAVDLFAQRLMEAPFSGALQETAVHCLRAISSGDVFLVSNERQRWSWLGVLSLAGVDVRSDPTLLVPLVAEEGPGRAPPKDPLFVGGGVWWPWQDPTPFLERALAHLDSRGRGRIQWYGGPPKGSEQPLLEHPRLSFPGWRSRGGFRQALAVSTAAFDWMEPHPERRLALSFRQMEYLGCGLPVMTGPDSPLAEVLGEGGWASWELEDVMDQVIVQPKEVERRSRAASKLAKERFGLERCMAPLLGWLGEAEARPRTQSALGSMAECLAEAQEERAKSVALERELSAVTAESAAKRKEIEVLNGSIQRLLGTIDRMSHAMDEMAGFKREATQILGGRIDQHSRAAEELGKENAILRADIEKKTAELASMDSLRERLENDLENLRLELSRSRPRGLFRR